MTLPGEPWYLYCMPSTTTSSKTTYYRSICLVNGDLVGEWEDDDLDTVWNLTPLGEYGDFADEEGPTGFFLYGMTADHEARFIRGGL